MRFYLFALGIIPLIIINGSVTANFGLGIGLLWTVPVSIAYGWFGMGWAMDD